MVNLSKLSKDELRATGFKNVSTARNYIKDILKTKAQKFKKEELINKLKSEFNKFKNFGIDLNEANKISKKTELTSKKAETAVKKGEQDLYDFTKDERDKIRNELKSELVKERKQKKAGKKIVKFARKNFAKEDETYYKDTEKKLKILYKLFIKVF
jgi:ribosomal protein L29